LCSRLSDARNVERRWEIADEPGEEAFRLEGDIGLVPLG
jgi:hypothetical protein